MLVMTGGTGRFLEIHTVQRNVVQAQHHVLAQIAAECHLNTREFETHQPTRPKIVVNDPHLNNYPKVI